MEEYRECAIEASRKTRPGWSIIQIWCVEKRTILGVYYFLIISEEDTSSQPARGLDIVAVYQDKTTRFLNGDYLLE